MFRNRTLSTMDPQDLAVLMPHLSERRVQRGQVLIVQGERVETVAFPVSAHVANTVTFADGRTAETFILGTEGATGVAPFLADAPCSWGVEVKTSGALYEIPAPLLRNAVEASPRLRAQFLRLANDYQTQSAIGVACAALHQTTERLALLILVTADRYGEDRLQLTQADLANMLGVQRTTVNASATQLKAAGAVAYSRGVIRIRDRSALEHQACECWSLRAAAPQAIADYDETPPARRLSEMMKL